MSSELEVIRYYEKQNEIVDLYVKGYRVIDIQKATGMKRDDIEKHLAEFRDYASQDKAIRERAKEVVLATDFHYASIVKELYSSVEAADLNDDYKARMTGLKLIADVEAKKVELLSKAGMLADNTIGDQIAETEKKQEILIGILRMISSKYPKIGMEISKELSKVTGTVEGVVIS